MPSMRIRNDNKELPHFVTLTVWNWYYLFDRFGRWDIVADSIKYLQATRNLQVFSYVLMLNHIHLLAQAPDLIACIRDFKRFTTKALRLNIQQTEPRILRLFFSTGQYRFWHTTNQPEVIETTSFLNQKMNYIHMNPVKKYYVALPEHWYWSSANPDSPIKVELA